MSRSILVITLIIAIFVILNAVAIAALLKLHPRRRRLTIAVAVLGNLFWLVIPVMIHDRLSPLARILRSILGPPWFSWLLFLILYDAFLLLLAIVWLVVRRHHFRRFANIPSAVFLALLGISAVAGVYQALVPIDVREVPVRIRDLPTEFEGYRIAILSDLHVGLFTRESRLGQLARVTNAASPDVIFLSGDLVDDDPAFVPKLVRGLDGFDPSTRVIAVLGNHEMYGDPAGVVREIEGTRIELLVNRGTELRREGARLWIAGLSDFAAKRSGNEARFAPDIDAALAGRPPGLQTILLAHQPKAFALAREKGIPLTLCGHSHGGQCGFRSLDWTLAGMFIPYHMGLYRENDEQLYVNTGTGYWLVPIRIGLLPEITIVELHAR